MKETIVGGKTLKVKFEQDGKLVEMQILEQDEKLRDRGLIKCNGEYAIKSLLSPTIGFKTLFIRGIQKAYDMEKDATNFLSEEQATEYIGEISRMIKEINDEAEEEEKERKTNKSIIINTDGYKVVTATLYDENGEQLRKETARCSPEDVFDFEVGAKLAVERIFEDKERIVVGDRALKVEFNRHGAEVTAKVLEMGESLRGKNCLASSGEYEVFSLSRIDMSEHYLFVRGNEKARDSDKAYWRFDSIAKAKKYIRNISELIREINRERKWNAKVVCVKSKSIFYTKGKIYEVKNGKITNNIGEDLIHSYESMDDLNAWTEAKFIEVVE